MKRLPTVFFLVAGCAVAQTYTYYSRSNVDPLTQPVEMFPVSSQAPRITAAPNIECDCTTTQVIVRGDPYSGVTTMSSSYTQHVSQQAEHSSSLGWNCPTKRLVPAMSPSRCPANLISSTRLILRPTWTFQA